MEALLLVVGGIVAVGALLVVSSIVRGFVLSTLWGWFIVPVFPGVPHLSIVAAIGISLVVGYLTYHYAEDKRSTGMQVGYAVSGPLLALLIGYIVHLFM